MKKPMHGITLETARDILAGARKGKVYSPGIVPKAHEVVAYWKYINARREAKVQS